MADPEPHDRIHDVQDAIQAASRQETAPAPVRRVRTVLFQGALVITIGLFAILAYLASTHAYNGIDVTITRIIQGYDSAAFETIMKGVSWFGYLPQAVLVAGALLLFLWVAGFRWEAFTGTLVTGGVAALNLVIKVAIQRPRPSADIVRVFKDVEGFSFPSGHVMFYVGLFGFMAFLAFSLLRVSWLRIGLVAAFLSLVLLVGISRVYLGEHWASDVIGGYLAGGLWLVGMIEIYRRGRNQEATSEN